MTTNKTIYLIRHGQTDYNKQGIIQGSGIDSDLNETGVQQAYAFYKQYKHVDFEQIYISELKRTFQSVKPFVDAGFSHAVLPELNEINWGIYEGKKATYEFTQRYNEVVNSWRKGELHTPIEGGESPMEMFNRQKIGWQRIMEESHENVLICMHGRAMRSFLSLILETPLSRMDDYDHSNLCLYKIEIKGKHKRLVEANNIKHLAGLR
ncbi:MAG: histidine phosphatase family protein [Flavobacteriales bacterium]|nr:histidine phosphatase family protein [Flavobacteriales bacterium]